MSPEDAPVNSNTSRDGTKQEISAYNKKRLAHYNTLVRPQYLSRVFRRVRHLSCVLRLRRITHQFPLQNPGRKTPAQLAKRSVDPGPAAADRPSAVYPQPIGCLTSPVPWSRVMRTKPDFDFQLRRSHSAARVGGSRSCRFAACSICREYDRMVRACTARAAMGNFAPDFHTNKFIMIQHLLSCAQMLQTVPSRRWRR